MESSTKKNVKKTNAIQFQALARSMEDFPHLATGSPAFGSNRAAMEQTWDTVAQKLNAYGPPERSGCEWKKVWQDQKSRVKKKIGENNKNLHGTGGGPCSVRSLTELEVDIDRICHLSSAAAPEGKIFGVYNPIKKLQFGNSQITPPRSTNRVAVVTPTTSNAAKLPEARTAATSPRRNSSSSLADIMTPNSPTQRQQRTVTHATSKTFGQRQKRKLNETHTEKNEQFKLLRRQLEVQEKSLEAMRDQAEAAKACAEAAKAGVEVAKIQAESLQKISESAKVIASALVDIVKHLKDDD